MTSTRIDIVTGFSPETTSLRNLRQSIQGVDDSWDVSVTRLQRPDLPGNSKPVLGFELGLFTFRLLWTGLKLRHRSDLVVIHKPLPSDLIEKLFDIPTAERVFLRNEPVVYATFDANYVNNQQKTGLLYDHSDLVYVTSRRIKQRVANDVPPDRIAFISPSVDTEQFRPNRRSVRNGNDMVLGWIGDVGSHIENLWLLADTLDEINTSGMRLKLVCAGQELPGSLKRAFESAVLEVDVSGPVPHDDIPPIIASFDVGLNPLRDTEFDRGRSSEKVREYMACGVPVVASDVGENPYLIPEDAGFIVSDPREWAQALETLSDSAVREKMGTAARQHAVGHYSIDAISQQIRSEFAELL